ncbi:unnamed protein product [Pleuronectes platessa]|uniref:Uncharacterized protein n=1 Tax=Pleuronectes platessa TaxID=8262 RepID=A0A9N7VNA1_PLEPL|nr:unnamed protein product [Pleuronectes platessa]
MAVNRVCSSLDVTAGCEDELPCGAEPPPRSVSPEGVAVTESPHPLSLSHSLSLPLCLSPPRLLLRPPRHRLLTKDAARRSQGAQRPVPVWPR